MITKKKETPFKVGQSIKIKKKNLPNFELSGKIISIQKDKYFVALQKCESWIEITEEEIVK